MIEEVPPPYSEIDIVAENQWSIMDYVRNHEREVERDRQNWILQEVFKKFKTGVNLEPYHKFDIELTDHDNVIFANDIEAGKDTVEDNFTIWTNSHKTKRDFFKFMRKRFKVEHFDFDYDKFKMPYNKMDYVNINGGKFKVTFDCYEKIFVFSCVGRNRTKIILD